MTIPYRRISQAEWETIPASTKSKSPSRWDTMLDDLEAGEPISIDTENESQARGYRIGLARRASSRGMKLEFRLHNGVLSARKSSETGQASEDAHRDGASPKRRGRPPKQRGQAQE